MATSSSFVPAKSPATIPTDQRAYLESEFHAIARAVRELPRVVASEYQRRRVYSPYDFDGGDFGERFQAAYNRGLADAQAGDGLGEGIAIVIPPNPDGGWPVMTTPVDLSSGGYVHVFGLGHPYIVAGDDLPYFFRFGVTNKADRVTLEGFELDPGAFTVTDAIRAGGGTRCRVSDIGFHKGGVGTIVNGLNADAADDPTGSGLSFLKLENFHDTGGGCITGAMFKANGLHSAHVLHMRVSKAATYGVHLISDSGALRGNTLEMLHGEAGLGTATALVRLDGGVNGVSINTVRTLNGNFTTDYGMELTGALAQFSDNKFGDVLATDGFTVDAILDSRV